MTPRIPQAAPEPQQLSRADAVGDLYRQHAVGLVRLALLLVGDQASAEDVVQEAFLGLYRNWPSLTDYGRLPGYLRVAVVNGSRGVLRARRRAWLSPVKHDPPVWSAEAAAMATEDRRAVLVAMANLPRRQREVPAESRRVARTSRRPTRVLGPFTAAASIALIAAGIIVVPKIIGATPSHHHHRSGRRPVATADKLTALPKFTVFNETDALVVMVTATGRIVGHVRVPAGLRFDTIVGTAGRTFYAAAEYNNSEGTCETYLYQFTLTADGQPSALKPLVVPKLTGLPTAIATDATGSLVAYSVVQCAGSGSGHIPAGQPIGAIGLIDLAARKITRQWTYTLLEDYTNDLSMSANGRLLGYSNYQGDTTVTRVLPVTAPSGPDQRRSHIVVHQAYPTAVSVTGSLLYAVTGTTRRTLGGYDTATGRLVQVLHQWPTAIVTVELIADPTGHYALLSVRRISRHKPQLYKYVRGRRCSLTLVHGKLWCGRITPPQSDFFSVNLRTGKLTKLPFGQHHLVQWGEIAW